jgi:phenylacetate-coenzyme A ligase PaaK-like adenylate-forming protein
MNHQNEEIPLGGNGNCDTCFGTIKKPLAVFQKAARKSSWYKKLLSTYGCDASEIETYDDFCARVPVLTKESVFVDVPFHELISCSPSDIHSFMLSSGQTGKFSAGIITCKEQLELVFSTDRFLENIVGIKKGEAVIINASAMGVRTFTSHTCCDTGPRSDIVVELLRSVSPLYAKTVLIADPYLVKQIVEDAVDAGIDFAELKIWFISGGDWLPETLRLYVHSLTDKSALEPERGYWLAIFGVTELGYPLFFETPELITKRSWCASGNSTIKSTYRMGKCITPFLFHYSTGQLFVEKVINDNGVPELVFTVLDEDRVIPMIRYKTGDIGEPVSTMISESEKLPFGNVVCWGRNNNWLMVGKEKVLINDIRELLFAEADLAMNITGYFTLEEQDGKPELSVQLKKNRLITPEMEALFCERVNHFYPIGLSVSFNNYHQFCQQMELDLERKFNHLKK